MGENNCISVEYFSGYKKPKPLKEQWEILKNYFPSLKISKENLDSEFIQEAYPKAEGLFLIPDWPSIAPTYGHAAVVALEALRFSVNGNFKNFKTINDEHLKQSRQLKSAWETIRASQDGDILVAPAQFGLKNTHDTTSSSRGSMKKNEFGLGLFSNTIMLITHPERLCNRFDLWIDCAGDEFLFAGKPTEAPCFFFDHRLNLGSYPDKLKRNGYGSPTFFTSPV